MAARDDDKGWVEDRSRSSRGAGRGSRGRGQGAGGGQGGRRSGSFDPRDLANVQGLSALSRASAPADLVSHTRSRFFKVERYYQWDNVAAWRSWKDLLSRTGGRDKWLFYGCTLSMAEELFDQKSLMPYGDFYPRRFGRDAIHLYNRASEAARIALEFGVEDEGLLVSCRLALGRVFRTRRANSRADSPPGGYDAVLVPRGTDLGSGLSRGDMYVVYDADRALMRYVTHILRAGRR